MININIMSIALDLMHVEVFHYKKKDNLIIGKGLRGGLDDTTPTGEEEYLTNFTETQKTLCLYYNGMNS